MQMYTKCAQCQKAYPAYMVEDYKQIWPTPLCPICGRNLYNRIRKRPPGTRFSDQDQQEVWVEAKEFHDNCKHNWGGCMINPPEECEYQFTAKDGGVWVDISICRVNCQSPCARHYAYLRMSQEEKDREKYDEGVLYL